MQATRPLFMIAMWDIGHMITLWSEYIQQQTSIPIPMIMMVVIAVIVMILATIPLLGSCPDLDKISILSTISFL